MEEHEEVTAAVDGGGNDDIWTALGVGNGRDEVDDGGGGSDCDEKTDEGGRVTATGTVVTITQLAMRIMGGEVSKGQRPKGRSPVGSQ